MIEDMTANLLLQTSEGSVTRQAIFDAVTKLAPIASSIHGDVVTDDDVQLVVKILEERFDITMTIGTLFAEEYRPWLASAKGNIDWFYWNRYRRYLGEKRLPPQVIQKIDSITERILDHLEDPKKEGKWSRRGMVVGHVQSGKTDNFIGVVNKAADSGYRVIVVLAGMLNSLRNQTQERLDMGFLGIDTSIPEKPYTGVGLLDRGEGKKPASFTTSVSDFKKATANSSGVGIDGLKNPAIFVIKKNKSTLTNLIEWLKYNTKHKLKDYPMLLIDDEADHASINTSDSGTEATAINKKIRELLQLFDRSAYVGYTATPFANVFIDPDVEEDLFPRDFIVSLDPPSNYFGSERIFSEEADLDVVRKVKDHERYFLF